MAKIFIQLISKSFDLHGDRIEIESDIIPRVGEIIDAAEYCKVPLGEVGDYIVTSVIYKITKEGFVPYITAWQWYRGHREELLQARGWLIPGENTNRTYDDNDEARLESVPNQ